MATDAELVRAFDELYTTSSRRTLIPGRLGIKDGVGGYTVDVPGRPGYVYVSLGVNGDRGQATAKDAVGVEDVGFQEIWMRRENGQLVIREAAHAAGGGGGSSTLAGLTDVAFTGLADGDLLSYDATAGEWVNLVPAGGSGDAPSPHALDSVHHSGTLADAQAPQFLMTNGSRNLTGNLTVSSGVTIDGVDISAHAANPDAHHDRVTVGNTGLALSTQVLSLNLATDPGLEISSGLRVKTGNGITRDSTGTLINLASNPGLEFSSGAIRVKAYDGINRDTNGIGVKLLSGMTALEVSSSGLALATAAAGSGLGIDATTRVLSVNVSNGLEINTDNVRVNQGFNFSWTGTHAFANNVTVDTTLFTVTPSTDIVTIDTNLLYADAPNNRIGINRTPSGAALDVIASSNSDHTQRLKQKSGQTGRIWRIEHADDYELIVLDSQANLQSGHPGFVSGLTGWQITPTGNAEFNNIWARGELHATVFVKEEVHISGGTLLVATGAKLYSDADIDATTVDTEEFEVKVGGVYETFEVKVSSAFVPLEVSGIFNYLEIEDSPTGPGFYFDIGETLRSKTEIPTGIADLWFTVIGKVQLDGYQSYSVQKRSGTDTTLPAGSGIGSWGYEGDGRILLTSDLNYAPYQDIFTIGPNVWTGDAGSIIPHVRLGRLDGVGVTAVSGIEQYGLIAGTDLSNANSPYIVASNLQLRLHKVDLTANDGSNDTVSLTSSGDFALGTNVALTATKTFSVQVTGADAGDLIIGDHTLVGNYLKWDKSAATLTINGALSVGGAGVATITYVDGEVTAVDTAAAGYASTAQSNAISTAASDATTKANAAQAAAISTAAADATTKANAAQAAAEAAAEAFGQARRVIGLSGTWTATDADTVSWTSASVRFGDGTTKSITNGNTGNMGSRSYLYVDATASAPLTLNVTTSLSTLGANHALIAVCDPGTDKSSVSIVAGSTYISGDNIATGSIVAANIKAGAITTTQLAAATITSFNTYADSAASTAQSTAISTAASDATTKANAAQSAAISAAASDATTKANAAQAAAEATAQTYANTRRVTGVTGTWTVTDADTITWSGVSIRLAVGTTKSVNNGSTGNMAAQTFLFVDTSGTAPLTLSSTTSLGSIPAGNTLIAVCTPGTDAATVQVVGGATYISGDNIATGSIVANNIKSATITGGKLVAGTITTTQIAAGAITANELAAGSVTSTKISVTNLQAVSANTGALSVTGNITVGTSGAIFSSGKTSYADNDPGFFLGWDSTAYKFAVGTNSNYLKWDGTNMAVAVNDAIAINVPASTHRVFQLQDGGNPLFTVDFNYPRLELVGSAAEFESRYMFCEKIELSGDTLTIHNSRNITTSGDTGIKGEICWNLSYLYVCVSTNNWRRISLGGAF